MTTRRYVFTACLVGMSMLHLFAGQALCSEPSPEEAQAVVTSPGEDPEDAVLKSADARSSLEPEAPEREAWLARREALRARKASVLADPPVKKESIPCSEGPAPDTLPPPKYSGGTDQFRPGPALTGARRR